MKEKRATSLIFAIMVLDLLGAGILLPILPYYVRAYRTDALTVGLLSLAFSAAQFLSSPALGAVSDRIGRRPVLLWSIFGSAAGYFLFGLAGSLWMLFAARLLDGVTGGNISTAQAYLADISAPGDRARNFGLVGAAWGIGFVAGPALGGALAGFGLAAPAFGAGVCSLLTFAAAYLFLPESLPSARRAQSGVTLAAVNPFRQLAWGIRHASLAPVLAAVFLFHFPMAGLQSNFSLFTLEKFAFTPSDNAWAFVFLGVMVSLLQGLILRRFVKDFGKTAYLYLGLWIMAAGYVVLAFSPNVAILYVSMVLTALGSSLAAPTLTALVSQCVPEDQQGAALGVNQSVLSLTRVAGPVWAGWLFDVWGPPAPYWTAVFWLGCALLLISARRGR